MYDESEAYMNHGQRPLPPPQEYRQFEGNPFATQEVKSKDKGNGNGKSPAVDYNNHSVFPSSPPRAQQQLGQLANNQFIHRESSGLPQNGQNLFTDGNHRNPVVHNGIVYPPWEQVAPRLQDNPFTDNSHLAPHFAPAVIPAAAPPVAPPRRNLSNRERQQYILPRTCHGLQNQRYSPSHILAPERPADESPLPARPISQNDSLFKFLLQDVRKPSFSLPASVPQTPVPRHPIQQQIGRAHV